MGLGDIVVLPSSLAFLGVTNFMSDILAVVTVFDHGY